MADDTSIMRWAIKAGLPALCVLSAPTLAFACPVCHTETGQQVRAGIFDEHFGRNLVLTLLPFPVLAVIAAAIHFGIPGGSRKRNT